MGDVSDWEVPGLISNEGPRPMAIRRRENGRRAGDALLGRRGRCGRIRSPLGSSSIDRSMDGVFRSRMTETETERSRRWMDNERAMGWESD